MVRQDFLEAIEVMKNDVLDNLQEQSVQKGSNFFCKTSEKMFQGQCPEDCPDSVQCR